MMIKLPRSFLFSVIFLIGHFYKTGKCDEISACPPFSSSSFENTTGIQCSLHTSFKVVTECPMQENGTEKSRIIRLHGEFGALVINCTAPFHLDLDYDGFRPTEAVELSIWKTVEIFPEDRNQNQTLSVSVSSFGLTVTIRSIQNLFDYIREYRQNASSKKIFLQQNLNSPIIYPRTGKFTIRGLHEKNRDKFQKFYFFFEEPLLENDIRFIDNEYTLKPQLININGNETAPSILIPCRPSHWTKNVALWYRSKTVVEGGQGFENFTMVDPDLALFDPTVGFQIPALNLNLNVTAFDDLTMTNFNVQCRVVSLNGKTSVWQADTKAGKSEGRDFIFGPHRLTEIRDTGNLRMENHVTVTSDDNYSLLRCFLDRRPESNDVFYSFGRPLGTMLELRYNQEMILPAFVSQSYWTQKWEVRDEILDIFMTEANPHGVVFCRKNHTYIYQQYASGLNLEEFKYGVNTRWENLPGRTTEAEFQIKIEMIEPNPSNTAEFYAHLNYIFHCHNSGFSFTKPVLWFIKYKNQTEVLVFKDNSLNSHISKLQIKLTPQVEQVFCVKFLWDGFDEVGEIPRNVWKIASTNVQIQDGTRPTIKSVQDTVYFPLYSKNQRLSCEADGDPTPSVWWEKNGEMLLQTGVRVAGTSSFEIPVIDEKSLGVYTCKARNDYGEAQVEIKVMAVPPGASFYILAVGLPIFVAIFIIAVLYLGFSYRRKLKLTRLTIQELKDFREGVVVAKTANSNLDKDLLPMSQPYKKELFEIPEEDFIIDEKRVLGSGAFGLVLLADIKGRQVAVKTTKPGADKSFLKSLLSELKILAYLGDHPHLINLVGASTVHLDKGIAHVFVELCEGGDLLSFLQKHREKFINNTYQNQRNETKCEFKIQQLHLWAVQVAKGMDYLNSKQVVHGDLAARNILLTAENTAKITDLGLSRQLYSCAIYQKQSKDPLPFRWMALEALEDLKFSPESDRWAYGVLLWEIYSLGQVPFPTFGWNPEFIQHLKSGHRLSCPPLLPHRIFSAVLMPCWEFNPEERPDFSTLGAILEKMAQKTNGKMEGENPSDVNYINALPDLSSTSASALSQDPQFLASKKERYTIEPTMSIERATVNQQRRENAPPTNYLNEVSQHENFWRKKPESRIPTISEIYKHPWPIENQNQNLYANISEALEQNSSSHYMNQLRNQTAQEQNYANVISNPIENNYNDETKMVINYQNVPNAESKR